MKNKLSKFLGVIFLGLGLLATSSSASAHYRTQYYYYHYGYTVSDCCGCKQVRCKVIGYYTCCGKWVTVGTSCHYK